MAHRDKIKRLEDKLVQLEADKIIALKKHISPLDVEIAAIKNRLRFYAFKSGIRL